MKRTVNKLVSGARRAAYLVPGRPDYAQFEITNRCNLNCAMCPRTKYYKVKIIDMPYDVYTAALDKLLPLRLATLTGWGEPLLHKQLYDMIRYARAKGVADVAITTNGVLLNHDHIKELLSCGLTALRVSVDDLAAPGDKNATSGHGGGAEIMDKVERLLAQRTGPLPRVALAVTISPENHDHVFRLIDRAAQIRMDMVALMRMNDRFDESLNRYSFEEEKMVCAEYIAHAAKAGIKIGTPQQMFKGIRRILYLGGEKCPVTYDSVYVTAEGKITPCCALPKFVIGDILSQDIETIWNSDKFKRFRRDQRQACAHCDLLDRRYKAR